VKKSSDEGDGMITIADIATRINEMEEMIRGLQRGTETLSASIENLDGRIKYLEREGD
jgi:archaellum component FlaC